MNNKEYSIDNRDIITTWLVMDNGDYIEVDPWKLVINAIENLDPPGMEQLIEKLNAYKETLGSCNG